MQNAFARHGIYTQRHKSSVDQTDRNKVVFTSARTRSKLHVPCREISPRRRVVEYSVTFRYIMLIRRETKQGEIHKQLVEPLFRTDVGTRKHVARYKQSLIETLLGPLIYGIHYIERFQRHNFYELFSFSRSARGNITQPGGANRSADLMIESVRNERAVAGFRLRERWIELSMGY